MLEKTPSMKAPVQHVGPRRLRAVVQDHPTTGRCLCDAMHLPVQAQTASLPGCRNSV